MKRRTLIISFLLGIALAIALSSAGRADELERSFPAADGGRLRIALEFGDVELVPVEGETLRIEARARGIGASGVHFDTRSEAGLLVLTGRAEPWVAWLRSLPRVQVRAFVPASWSVDLPEVGSTTASLGSFVVHQP
jgi:hypothetical protein